MASLSVSSALNLAELVLRLYGNLNPRKDVLAEIISLEGWLRTINAFMEDNDGREGSSSLLNVKVEQFREIAYDIEDVLDEILFHTPPYSFHEHEFSQKVHTIAHNVRHGFPFREISDKMAIINKSLSAIGLQNNIFPESPSVNPGPSSSFPSSSSSFPSPASAPASSSSRTRVASSLLLDDEMVGYEEPKREFINQLMNADPSLVRVAVKGPSGSGKMTIVKNVYFKEGIWGQFDCHAWVHVSSQFNDGELCKNMLKQLCDSRKEPYPSDDESLDARSKLKNYLTRKKYIVVLDEIWSTQQWDRIKDAFPDSHRGSRIIFTTRSSDVAAAICASPGDHICSLENGLDLQDAQSLLCRKAFPYGNRKCPSELKEISSKIVQRCKQRPLAIVAVGGALAQRQRQRLPNEWGKFHSRLGSQPRSNSNLSVNDRALLLAYVDLHTNLKSCFLYFRIFAEDYSVERGRLIRLWVAEGFVKERDGMTAEEVAEENLYELIHRNLVHVSDWDFDEQPRNCRVVNRVLRFIIQKCTDENFASIFPRENQQRRIRRLSLTHLPPQNEDFSRVRSMFLLRSQVISQSDLKKVLRDFKLLKVLDLQGAPLKKFAKAITLLVLLRYLSLRATKIDKIPSSIKKLSYLETLDLKQTDVIELPNEISHLHNLRHLFAYKYDGKFFVVFDSVHGVKISEGICNLANLQDLSLVKVDEEGRILEELQKLSQLRKLGLMGIKGEHGKALCASIQNMRKLTTLSLSSITKEEFLEVGEMVNPPSYLERLYLKGRLKEFPGWISYLTNLRRIGLNWSKMEQSPLGVLKSLRNLMELQLVDSYTGDELKFEASGFKKLKILLIEDFSKLNKVVIEEGAIPELEKLSLRRCPKLLRLPLGMEKLAKVGEMILHDMPEKFIVRLRKNGEDHALVEYIRVVHSFVLDNQAWVFENLSDWFSC
ncbi:hypothetical protein BUALT_Bualt18G0108100 [Buddleja alternifolia]|uniref:Uncharacterized protein n=1 Tax=Buddleja alternifolia TaxID=168488 RepID=A0AAV6WEU2_9LAMI|nr:hypothetical protein BUALT_Bualt18G0108100 [Buddleja alternifolia]